MTQVKILDKSAACNAIFNAICRSAPDVLEKIGIIPDGGDTMVDVVVTVNGVEVDFFGVFAHSLNEIDTRIDSHIADAALELFRTRLDKFSRLLGDVEHRVKSELNSFDDK